MPIPYKLGVRMEYKACEELRKRGYEAQRTAGSHSPFDIVAWDENVVMLIQVKRVGGATGIPQALNEARDAWEDHRMPTIRDVIPEVWVRHEGRWHTFIID